MHYKINGKILKTENAAKSVEQPSRFVLDWISELPSNSKVLDYGCGKFRYTIPLSKRVKLVYAVDSIYQIDRKQIINQRYSDIKAYSENYLKNVKIFDVDSKGWKKEKFDFVLCSNVLSAIPFKQVRIEVLQNILKVLAKNGKLLVCNQFRNTYFKAYETNPSAKNIVTVGYCQVKKELHFMG